MEYIFEHNKWKSENNCSLVNVDSIPLQERTTFNTEAIVIIIICAISYVIFKDFLI